MNPLYFYLLAGSLFVPLCFTIWGIDFIRHWKKFALSTTLVAVVFLIWDILFTEFKIWGFTDSYCLGVYFLKIPIEEWLFFFIIPFCSLFIHFALLYALPNAKISKPITFYLSLFLIGLSIYLVLQNTSRLYTVIDFTLFAVVLAIGVWTNQQLLQKFYISFCIILIPFLIVNGVLTGAFTESPVVWYDHSENLSIRLYTIPVEDVAYNFILLFGNLLLFEKLNKPTRTYISFPRRNEVSQ